MSVKKMPGRVSYKANLAGSTWLVGIDLPEEANFLPGQYISLKVNDEGLRRSYSIASMPGKKNIELVIDVSPMGIGSKYILGLSVGDPVEVLGFLGKFLLDEKSIVSQCDILMVATGTGIVPFRPMIEELLSKRNFRGRIKLIWGMRHERDLFWVKEIDKYQREYDNFHFDIVLSKPETDWPGVQGHVGDIIKNLNFNCGNLSAYLCGNPEMISEVKEILINMGAREGNIFYERFA